MLSIPQFLVGRQASVRRAWRALASRLLKGQHWDEVFPLDSLVPIDSNSYPICVGRPGSEADDDEQIILYPVFDHLNVVAGRNNYRDRGAVRQLILTAVRHDWACLALLAAPPRLLPLNGDDAETCRDAIEILSNVTRCWERLVALEGRYLGDHWFDAHWPSWSLRLFPLCHDAGMSRQQIDSIIAARSVGAGASMDRYLASVRRS